MMSYLNAATICFALTYHVPAGVVSTHPQTLEQDLPSRVICENEKHFIENYRFSGWSADWKHQIKVRAYHAVCRPGVIQKTTGECDTTASGDGR